MKKKKKQRKPISKKEFIFNVISLLLLISVGVFYEVRAYHFFKEEKTQKVLTDATLNGAVLDNNKIATSGSGLYKDNDGYYFKGDVNNNYVKFANRLFRIIRVNENGSVKLISYDLVGSFMNGNTTYENGNVRMFLNKTNNKINDTDHSGVYYDTIPNGDYFLKTTKYSIDKINKDKVEKSDKEFKDYITTLTLDDYITAGGKNSFLNISKYFYIIGIEGDNNILSVYEDGTIEPIDSSESSGVRAVFTLKKNLKITQGNGSIENPYTIDQKSYKNYVDNYIRLGNNMWKVYYDKNKVIKLALNGYYMQNNTFVKTNFATEDNIFDENNRHNIGYVLNHDLYNSLYYNNIILNNNYYIGSIGEENKYSYSSIYSNSINTKIGLLNIFDYNNTLFLDDFYMMNANDDNVIYVYKNNGVLEEVSANDERLVVPVIALNKGIIKRGSGSIDDPYEV